MSIANAPVRPAIRKPAVIQQRKGSESELGPLASFRRRHGVPPRLVRLRATVFAAIALVPAAISSAVFDEAAGGTEASLDFVSTFTCACILVWFLLLALTTGAAWAQQQAPPEQR